MGLLIIPILILLFLLFIYIAANRKTHSESVKATDATVGTSLENDIAESIIDEAPLNPKNHSFYDIKQLYFKMELDFFLRETYKNLLSWKVRQENGLSLLSDFPVFLKFRDGNEEELYIYVNQDRMSFSLAPDGMLKEKKEKSDVTQWFKDHAEYIASKIKECEVEKAETFVIPFSLLIDTNTNNIMEEFANRRFPQSVMDDEGNLIVAIP